MIMTETKQALRARLWGYLVRWQVSHGWLPLLVLFSLLGWVGLRALDRFAGQDALSLLVQLPMICAYAAAALVLTKITVRQWRQSLTSEQKQALWAGAQAGQIGPLVIQFIYAAFTLGVLCALLLFFSQAF